MLDLQKWHANLQTFSFTLKNSNILVEIFNILIPNIFYLHLIKICVDAFSSIEMSPNIQSSCKVASVGRGLVNKVQTMILESLMLCWWNYEYPSFLIWLKLGGMVFWRTQKVAFVGCIKSWCHKVSPLKALHEHHGSLRSPPIPRNQPLSDSDRNSKVVGR